MPSDVIFDFFGTLVQYTAGAFHTAPYERTHAFLLGQGFTIEYPTFVRLYSDISATLERQAQQTAREYHMDDVARAFFRAAFDAEVSHATVQAFVTHFNDEWSRGIRYLDGVQPFLHELAATYRLTVLSNTHSPALIHDHLARMGVAHYFTHIITSVEVGWRKPHPHIFQHALTTLAIPAQQAVYIGDTYTDDYEGATAAGIRAILIDPNGTYPQIGDRIASLFEVRNLLKDEEPHAR